jgi:hypothetical protein
MFMEHYAALFSIVFMIGFVGIFDLRHARQRLSRLWNSITLMNSDELEQIRMIWSACEEA